MRSRVRAMLTRVESAMARRTNQRLVNASVEMSQVSVTKVPPSVGWSS